MYRWGWDVRHEGLTVSAALVSGESGITTGYFAMQ
jgi:hypothetical protein